MEKIKGTLICPHCTKKINIDTKLFKDEDKIDWKDLDIKNIPTDFFDNKNYVVEYKNKRGDWKETHLKASERGCIISNVARGINVCRYRLKYLESIRIPEELVNDLAEGLFNHYDGGLNTRLLEDRYGRKVEIIQ